MTKRLGYQKEALDKQSVLKHFRSSNYEDCRVNAYPSFTNFHGINRTPPSFIIIDLDLKTLAIQRTIRIYSKDMKDGNKTRIRMERQECPNKTLEKAMKEKLEECRVRYLSMYKGI